MGFYKHKKVLVTGGTGLIGRPLVSQLVDAGAYVRVASLDDPVNAHPQSEFHQCDLTDKKNCRFMASGIDTVFHCAGTKGSPQMMRERPADYFVPALLYNTNMMQAALEMGVKRYLFTSSVAVYAPSERFIEDAVWQTFPSPNDRFAGWAKRMGELQAEACAIQSGWDKISVVRPANVYGPYDNLNPKNQMVITALVKRVVDGENPLRVVGDGSAVRDFIHARDVARAMMTVVESGYTKPVNIGTGVGNSIKEIADSIAANVSPKPTIEWDTSAPSGDAIRVVDTSRLSSLGFTPQVSLEEGIREVIAWYKSTRR